VEVYAKVTFSAFVILSLSKDQFGLPLILRATELILRQAQDDGIFMRRTFAEVSYKTGAPFRQRVDGLLLIGPAP